MAQETSEIPGRTTSGIGVTSPGYSGITGLAEHTPAAGLAAAAGSVLAGCVLAAGCEPQAAAQ